MKPIRALASTTVAVGLLLVVAAAAPGSPAAPAPASIGLAATLPPVPTPDPDADPSAGSDPVAGNDPAPGSDPALPDAAPAAGTPTIGSVSQAEQNPSAPPEAGDVRRATVPVNASAAQKSAAIWAARGRPDRLIIVRRSGVDTVADGRLQRHAVRYVGTITLRTLSLYVPSTWLSIDGPNARLSATLVLSTDVTLDVDAPVRTLALTGGAAAAAAASVFTGGGTLALRGVTVTSADPVTGAPMPVGPGRPYIVASQGGRLDATDATIGDLGSVVGPTTYPGLTFNAGSGGSVVRTTLPRNSIGLRLEQSDGIVLQDVTVSAATTDGLVLRGDTGSVLTDVRAEGNGKNGVVLSGASSARPITGISTRGNRAFGMVVVGQTGARITGVATTGDGAGGMEINHSSDVTVTGFTATDQPIGIYTHVSSSRITIDGLTVDRGRRGVIVEKTTTDLQLTRSTIEGTELGVSLGAHRVQLRDVTVKDSQTAVAIQRGAAGVTIDRLTITGGKDGLVANPGTSGVVIRDLAASDITNTAVRELSPDAQVLGAKIDGSSTGIDVLAPTTLSGVAIEGADTGIRARTAEDVRAADIDIAAISVGIAVEEGTPFLLSDSRVNALESIRGTAVLRGVNDLSLPPLRVLGAIGVPLVLLAVVLEMVAALRQWRRRRRGPRGPGTPSITAVRRDSVATAAS